MQINIPIQTAPKEKITTEEVRNKLREIQDSMFGTLVRGNAMYALNDAIQQYVNIPYGLNIKAELIGNNVKLFGYDMDSKAVLDPNCGIEFISKTRFKGK